MHAEVSWCQKVKYNFIDSAYIYISDTALLYYLVVFIPVIFFRTHWNDLSLNETCPSLGSVFHGTFLRRA
jgi:hypothetical protein